jgi:DNA-binding CsgD family transcriptional regulator
MSEATRGLSHLEIPPRYKMFVASAIVNYFRTVSRISWKRINEAVEAIEGGGTPEGVFGRALEQLDLLAPSAQGVAVPNFNLSEIRQRIGRPNPQMITRNSPHDFWESYISYYEARDPRQNEAYYRAHSGVVTVDASPLYTTEFGHDFLKRHRVRYFLCLSNLALPSGRGFLLSLYRSTPFSQKEVDAATALFPHIHNLSLLAANPAEQKTSRALAAGASAGLSAREQDVAVLLSQRMSIREIADRLFISRHTVEKHMQHIYWKLNASGKTDVRRLLLGDLAD